MRQAVTGGLIRRTPRRVLASLFAGALLLSGCSASDDPQSAPTSSHDGADAPADADVTIVDADGNLVDVDPRPTDFVGAIARLVESGMSEPEAVLTTVEGALGLAEAPDGLDADSVEHPHLSPLLVWVIELLESGTLDDQQRQRAQTALAVVQPSEDFLERVSRPESAGRPAASVGSPGPRIQLASVDAAGPRLQAQGLSICQQLAVKGSAVNEADLGLLGTAWCYVYREAKVDGLAQRVYYPADWIDDDAKQEMVAATMEAVLDAQLEFASHNGLKIGSLNAILNLPNDNKSVKASAGADFAVEDPDAPCTVYVYELVQKQFETQKVSKSTSRFYFQHTIAHEVFHCTQFRSFTRDNADVWWREGTAEYFALLAVPSPSDQGRISIYNKFHFFHFNEDSLQHALWADELHYKNWVFFLRYAMERGNAKLVELMGSLDGGADPLGALGAIDDIDEFWNEFVRDFVAEQIFDPQGHGPIESGIDHLDAKVSGRRIDLAAAKPFVATRFRVPFADDYAYGFEDPIDDLTVKSVEFPSRTRLESWSDEVEPVYACALEPVHGYAATVTRAPTEDVRLDVRPVRCGCPVDAKDVSTATGREHWFRTNETGTVESEVPRSPGVIGGCILYADPVEPTLQPGAQPVGFTDHHVDAQGELDWGESQVAIGLLDPGVFRPENHEARVSESPDAVTGFPGPAVYLNEDRIVEGRGHPWDHRAQRLDVLIGPIIFRIDVLGKMLHEVGVDGVLEQLRTLVDIIVTNIEEDPGPDDDSSAGSGGAGTGGGGSGVGGGSGSGSGGAGNGGAGGSSTGGFFGDAATATFEAEGQSWVFQTVLVCNIGPDVINAHFAVDQAGVDGGTAKADAESGLVTVQTRSPLESREGYRLPMSLSDSELQVTDGSFTITGPATFHEDVRDLGDAGRSAGDATLTMTC